MKKLLKFQNKLASMGEEFNKEKVLLELFWYLI